MKTITRTLSVLLSVLFLTLAVISVFCFSTSAAEPSAVQPRAVMDNAYISQKIADFASKRYYHNSTYVDDPDHTGGYECFGFANEIAKYIFGSYPTYYMSAAYVYPGWTVKYGGSAVDNLRVGDIVRYWYHSIFITGIDGDIITYCQANVPSGTNRVTYGNTITRSELKSRVSQQLTSGTTKTGWVAHYDQNMWTPAHVHTPLKQPAVAPTCTTHGLTAGSICSECFYNIEPQEIIIALGHNHVASVTAPTCTKEGYTTHTCARCGDSYSDSKVPAKGHTPGSAATCTSAQVCTTCGTVVKTKLGHSYTVTVTDPTCTEEGYTAHTCSRCGDSYSDSKVPAKGHTPIVIPGVYPTLETEGLTDGSACQECGEILMPQESIPKQDEISGSVSAAGSGTVIFTIDLMSGEMLIQGWQKGGMGNYTGVCENREFIWYEYSRYIRKIIIEDSITDVGDYAFFGLTSLEEVVLPDSVVHIGQAAFSKCSSLSKINIPNGVKSIGPAAFSYCGSLTECDLPVGLEQVSEKLFMGCVNLSRVTIPATVSIIGSRAFESCESLTKVDIPSGVITIEDSAFRHCLSLNSVSLPTTLRSIWGCAFDNCPALTVADYQGTEEEWNREVALNQNDSHASCNLSLKKALVYLPAHTHSYSGRVVSEDYLASPATDTTPATYYYSCSCGERGTETFTYGATDPQIAETIPVIHDDPYPEPETSPMTETPSDDSVTTEEPAAEELSTDPTVTVGCSGSILSCGLLMLIVLAGAALIKRKE